MTSLQKAGERGGWGTGKNIIQDRRIVFLLLLLQGERKRLPLKVPLRWHQIERSLTEIFPSLVVAATTTSLSDHPLKNAFLLLIKRPECNFLLSLSLHQLLSANKMVFMMSKMSVWPRARRVPYLK